jgi:hypothetical protein
MALAQVLNVVWFGKITRGMYKAVTIALRAPPTDSFPGAVGAAEHVDLDMSGAADGERETDALVGSSSSVHGLSVHGSASSKDRGRPSPARFSGQSGTADVELRRPAEEQAWDPAASTAVYTAGRTGDTPERQSLKDRQQQRDAMHLVLQSSGKPAGETTRS